MRKLSGFVALLTTIVTVALLQAGSQPIRARKGMVISIGLSRSLGGALEGMKRYPASVAQFSKNGARYEAGEVLRQLDLAGTLERIAAQGPAGFYEGETALLVEKEMKAHGGLITRRDLKSYQAKSRPTWALSWKWRLTWRCRPPG